MGVSKNRRILPPKWMVFFMENPIKMDDLGGFPIFLETPRSTFTDTNSIQSKFQFDKKKSLFYVPCGKLT